MDDGLLHLYWGGLRADVQQAERQLGFCQAEVQVRWLGVRGLMWSWLFLEIQYYAGLDKAPNILVVYTVGNDLQ